MYIQTVSIQVKHLDPSVHVKIQGVAHYVKFKNERCILIGYWLLAHWQLLCCDVFHVHTLRV